jgi:hypothetical protein
MMSQPATAYSNGTRTLAQMYTRIECGMAGAGSRRIVSRARGAEGWADVPGWRFFRSVVRVALFMRERAGISPGSRVAVVSPIRTERLVVEWAAVTQGAVIAVVDPTSPDEALSSALARLSPKIVLSTGQGTCQRILRQRGATRIQHVVSFDDEPAEGVLPWTGLLDLAGTLDTAERAQAFRAAARAVRPEMPAVAHLEAGSWSFSTHAQLVHRLVEFWDRFPPRRGETAYVIDPGGPARVRLPLWAFVADGETTMTIGTPGRQTEELAELKPGTIAMPPDALPRPADGGWTAAEAHDQPAPPESPRASALARLARRLGTASHVVRPARRAFTLEGDARSLA